jgi:hypothetical protein
LRAGGREALTAEPLDLVRRDPDPLPVERRHRLQLPLADEVLERRPAIDAQTPRRLALRERRRRFAARAAPRSRTRSSRSRSTRSSCSASSSTVRAGVPIPISSAASAVFHARARPGSSRPELTASERRGSTACPRVIPFGRTIPARNSLSSVEIPEATASSFAFRTRTRARHRWRVAASAFAREPHSSSCGMGTSRRTCRSTPSRRIVNPSTTTERSIVFGAFQGKELQRRGSAPGARCMGWAGSTRDTWHRRQSRGCG